jgi:hypothetical protein
MATQLNTPRLEEFQSWSFEKAMLEAQQRSPSESSSSEFYDEKVRIAPDLKAFQKSLDEQKSPAMFSERYMSSEEALSPMGNEDSSADEVERAEKIVIESAVKFAVAICILSVGKPKVVDIPVPSLTNSPSVQSTSSGKSSYNDSFLIRPPTPVKSIKRKAVPFEQVRQVPALRPRPSSEFSPSRLNFAPHLTSLATIRTQIPKDSEPTTPVISAASTTPSFLVQDPCEKKSSPPRFGHSRLRNLSQKFSRLGIHASSVAPTTEPVPSIPAIPPPPKRFHAALRKGSIPAPSNPRELKISPPITSSNAFVKRKMIPRGAAERAPPIEIPPCPDDLEEFTSFRAPRIRRRRSLMGF